MSDRVAVFDRGRIEQVGSPREIYERPASEFVAGFVGTSNLLRGDTARTLVGSDGVFTVRPEKIRLVDVGARPADGEVRARGCVEEVVYAGAATRVVVRLEAGGRLTVLRPNDGTAVPVEVGRGSAVVLVWRPEHTYPVGETDVQVSTCAPRVATPGGSA